MAETTETPPRVSVIVRGGCHLCDQALDVVRAVCDPLGITWQAVDVDTDPALRAEHTDHVPVTFVDGRRVAIWFLDEQTLRTALGVANIS